MYEKQELNGEKNKWILAVALFILVALGTFHYIFSLIGFAVFVYVVAFGRDTDVAFLMVFGVSLANIFKISPRAQSLFTYVMLGYVLYKMLQGRGASDSFWQAFVMLLVLFGIESLVSVNILKTIKLLANFLLIYFMLYDAIDHEKDIFLGYIAGVISSSAVVWMNVLPNFSKYIQVKSMVTTSGRLDRFAGMYGDPNYYSVNLIIALCLLVILYHRKELKTIPFVVCSVMILFFSIMTYSKSSFLMLLLPILLFFYTNSKNGRYFLQITCFAGLFLAALYALAGKIDFLSGVIDRIKNAESINELTTGRTDLWAKYLESFSKSMVLLLIGNGPGGKLVGGYEAHNTYLELVHRLGLIGTTLVVVLLRVTVRDFGMNRTRKNFLNYSVFMTILVMYFFLSELFYFDMPFHILLAILVFNMDFQTPRSPQTIRM